MARVIDLDGPSFVRADDPVEYGEKEMFWKCAECAGARIVSIEWTGEGAADFAGMITALEPYVRSHILDKHPERPEAQALVERVEVRLLER